MSKEVNFYSSSVRILYSLIFKPSDELIKESINNNGTSEANELDKLMLSAGLDQHKNQALLVELSNIGPSLFSNQLYSH